MSSKTYLTPELCENLKHTCSDRTPYCYLIGWSKLDKWYYGSKTAKNCKPSDFWKTYFTSSKYVKMMIKEHGNPDVIQIRRIFNDITSCKNWESKVLYRINASKSTKWLNQSYGDGKWDTTKKVVCYDIKTKECVGLIDINDDRIGKSLIKIYDFAKPAITLDGVSLGRIPVDDPRWITGEIILKLSTSTLLTSEKIKGKKLAMNKITGEKFGFIPLDDPLWNDPNIICYTSIGKSAAIEVSTGKKLGKVDKTDPRWATGEIRGVTFNTTCAIDTITGESLGRISKDDPRWETGEISVNQNKYSSLKEKSINTTPAVCVKTGTNLGRVSKDDPRWLSGEIVTYQKYNKQYK